MIVSKQNHGNLIFRFFDNGLIIAVGFSDAMSSKSQTFIPVELYRKVFDKKLKPNQLTVLLAMLRYGNYGENIFPSEGRIAHDTNYSIKTIPLILKELVDLGVLIRNGKTKFGTVIYSIDLDVLPDKEPYLTKKQKLQKLSQQNARPNYFSESENTYFDDDDIAF